MNQGTQRAVVVGGLAATVAVVALLISRKSAASTSPSPQPPAPSGSGTWVNATQSDVTPAVQARYGALLQQPLGTVSTETIEGKQWKFTVCGGMNCNPPSLFDKDVRGQIYKA